MIDDDLGPADRKRVLEHLRSCRQCFEMYQESTIYQELWEAEALASDSVQGLIDAGRRLSPHGPTAEVIRKDEERPMVHAWLKGRRLGIATACVAVLVVAIVWLGSVDRVSDTGLSPEILAPVRAAVETASLMTKIVIPGGEQSLDMTGLVYRSGSVPLNDSLEASLKQLYKSYREGSSSGEVAYWLVAGYVATGQVDAARDLVSGAREQHPDDSRIAILQAIIDYIDGDYERSERLLRGVLDVEPDNPLASINLAIVLNERGNNVEARAILERVRDRHAGTPFSARAQSILSELQEP